MKFKSIRMRMLVLLCAIVILALGVASYVGWSSSYDILFNASISGGHDAADLMLKEIQIRLAEPSGEVSALSSDELFAAWLAGRAANPLVLGHMQTILGHSRAVDRITLVDLNGRSLDSTLGANAVALNEEGQWYERAMSAREGAVVYGEPYLINNEPAVSIAAPVFSGGRRVGACAVQIFLREDVFSNVRQFKFPKIEGASGYCWVVDREGMLISHPFGDRELTQTLRNHSNPDLAQVIEDMIVGIGKDRPRDSRYIYDGVDKYVFWRVHPESGFFQAHGRPQHQVRCCFHRDLGAFGRHDHFDRQWRDEARERACPRLQQHGGGESGRQGRHQER